MKNKKYISAVSVELTEKIAAAKGYRTAQESLMHAIVDEADESLISYRLDVVRIRAAVFYSTQPFESGPRAEFSSANITATVSYVEMLVEIRKSESLISEWLATAERPGVSAIASYLDRALGIGADPRFDIFVVAGEQAEELETVLKRRDYARVLRWDDLRDPLDVVRADSRLTDRALESIPDLSECRPQRVWCLWGADQECPQNVKEELDARLRKVMINRNTVTTFAASWAKHFIQNIPSLTEFGRDTFSAANLLNGSGAIIVGAGPSLDEHIEWIKKQSPTPVIIASYKSLKALYRNGITPHFVVMLDPNQQLRHLDGLDLSGIVAFVVEVSVRPDVLERVNRPLLPYFAGDGTRVLGAVFAGARIPTIPTGGSVLHAGLQFAKLLGCCEVTLVGADFGFPNEKLYATGSGEGDRFFVSGDRRSYQRAPLDSSQRVGVLIDVPSNDGNMLCTSLELDTYRVWTEEFIRDSQEKSESQRFFNLSRHGARIEGAQFVDGQAHRAKPAVLDPATVIDGLPKLIKSCGPSSALVRKLKARVKKLRALQRSCLQAVAGANSVEKFDAAVFNRVVKEAASCPEVSLLLTQQLQDLDELVRRSSVAAPARLTDLVAVAGREASTLADLYSNVLVGVVRRSAPSVQHLG